MGINGYHWVPIGSFSSLSFFLFRAEKREIKEKRTNAIWPSRSILRLRTLMSLPKTRNR